jgi:hypothetical protein
MSRTAFKRTLGEHDSEAELHRAAGLVDGIDARWFSGTPDTSEMPNGYKNAESVRRQIARFGLAEIVDEVLPFGCIMAGEIDWRKAGKELGENGVRNAHISSTLTVRCRTLHTTPASTAKTTPKDWPAFFAACDKDAPIPHMIELAQSWRSMTILFVTGRSDDVREKTLTWLQAQLSWRRLRVPIDSTDLFMRRGRRPSGGYDRQKRADGPGDSCRLDADSGVSRIGRRS